MLEKPGLWMVQVIECAEAAKIAWNVKKKLTEISFGGIPTSSSLMPCLTTWAHSCSAMVLPMRTMSSPKGVQKQSHGCFCQGCKATNHTLRKPPEPSRSCIPNLPPAPASGTYTSTHWNPPEPSRTYTSRNPPKPWEPASATWLPPQPTPAHTGTLRNLPPEPTPAHAATLRNLPQPASGNYTSTPEPSGTCLRNLHQHTPEPSGTFRNLPLEPTPAHAGTLRNLPEPSSGTCSCDPHRHTPELIWAKDPISLRCWGKKGKDRKNITEQSLFRTVS